MNFKVNGNLGCFVLILVLIVVFSTFSFLLKVIFTTPIGIVLLLTSIGYMYLQKRKLTVTKEDAVEGDTSEKFTDDNAPIIDVEYEDLE